jgi:hypothetical protein
MKRYVVWCLSVGFLMVGCKEKVTSEAHNAPTTPNIVLFLVDDMGWQDTSVAFWNQRTPYNDLYQTPNMERLHKPMPLRFVPLHVLVL